MLLDLDLVKKHLNLESDFCLDDELILQIMGAAEQAVEVHVNESLDTLAEKNGGCVPTPLLQAMLLYISTWYNNREIFGTRNLELPKTANYLIDLYRNYN